MHAFPLRLRKDVIGAMSIFGTDIGGFDDMDVQIVQALADVAAIGLLRERAIDAAFALIRGHARRTNRRLSDVAREIVSDVTKLPDLT